MCGGRTETDVALPFTFKTSTPRILRDFSENIILFETKNLCIIAGIKLERVRNEKIREISDFPYVD